MLTGSNVLPLRHWLGELNRNFAGYYLVGSVAALLTIALTWRSWVRWRASVVVFLVLVSAYPAVRSLEPYYLSSPLTTSDPARSCEFTVATVNIGIPHQPELLQRWLDTESPDVVAFIEWVPKVTDSLRLRNRYPFIDEVQGTSSHGIAVASRYPFVGEITHDIGAELHPVIRARIDPCKRGSLSLTALHAFPPLSARAYHLNQLLFRRVALHYRHEDTGPALVMGDFNATPFSDLFGRIPVAAGFDSVFVGFGLTSTWNARFPLARFSIDHILIRGTFSVHEARRGPDVGSDHFPVIARLSYSGIS